MNCNLITVLGPTASGKTTFGAGLAGILNGEIISADSRQVYREMDLGTGKDYEDYQTENGDIPYHLIDIYPAGYKYNVYEFQKDFFKVFESIVSRKKLAFMVGGSGMYIESVLNNYELVKVPVNESLRSGIKDKTQIELAEILNSYHTKQHNSSDSLIRERTIRAIEIAEYNHSNRNVAINYPKIQSLIFGINIESKLRRKKITDRLNARLNEGMVSEVENLLKKIPSEDLMFYGLEYKFITLHLIGKISYQEMFNQLNIAIHQFAKRQMTWFRRMERNGLHINWLDGSIGIDEKIDIALKVIKMKHPELVA